MNDNSLQERTTDSENDPKLIKIRAEYETKIQQILKELQFEKQKNNSLSDDFENLSNDF